MAASGTTKSGYIACTTEQHLDDVMSFAVNNDTASVNAYISSYKCVSLRGGLNVTIMDTTWTGKIQFAFEGTMMWTVSEAVYFR